jgi:uncharacterized integral membrane protein
MADPHVVSALDAFDRRTVRLYRVGFWVAAAGLGVGAGGLWAGVDVAVRISDVGLVGGVLLLAHNAHLYLRQMRWALVGLAALGAWLSSMVGAPPVVLAAGVGFAAAALSGFALKEWICFQIPGQRVLPVVLCAYVFLRLAPDPRPAALAASLATVLAVVLAVAKTAMPLHYDIGDKTRYEI